MIAALAKIPTKSAETPEEAAKPGAALQGGLERIQVSKLSSRIILLERNKDVRTKREIEGKWRLTKKRSKRLMDDRYDLRERLPRS